MNGNGFFNPFGSPGSSGGGGGGGTSEKVRYSISKFTNDSTGEVTYKLMQSLNNGTAIAVGEVIGVRGSQILVTYNNQQVLLDTAIENIEQLLDKTYNFTTFSELNIDTHNKTLTEITNELIAKNLPTNTIVTGQLYSDALPFSGNGEAEVLVNHPAYWWKCGSLNIAPYSWTAITGSSVWGDNGLVMDWTPSNFTLPTASADTLGGVKVGSGLSIDGSGVLSADGYTLPTASANTLGGIKVGEGLEMTEGVLSVIAGTTYTAGNGIKFVDGSRLPSGYTPVEYLYGTGQCIQNLFSTTPGNIRIETEFACDVPSSGEIDIIGGGGDPNWANVPILILQTSATINAASGHNTDVTLTDYQIATWLYNTYAISGVTPSINTFHTVVADWHIVNGQMSITVDGDTHSYNCEYTRATNLCLFGNGQGGNNPTNIKMKYLKIYQGSMDYPVMNLIPVKNSSNVYGMYDLVSRTFFTKTGGNGDFSGGDAIMLPSSTAINVIPATSVAIGGVIIGNNINVDANGTISVDKTIKTIAKTGTSGLVDSYRITFNDNTYFDFTVTNGANGANGQDGSPGTPGQDGDDGVSITGAAIDNTGHLIITLSEGPSIDAGMAKGADGTSVTILDTFSSTADLPSTGQHNGDGYLINGDLWVYTGGTDPGMVNGFKDVGTIQGPAGRSITAVSISQGDLYITFSDNPSTPVYIGPIKGDKGDTGNTGPQGPDGKSAYQVWLDAGNVGTVSDYLNSLVGAQGNPGPAGKGIASIQKTGTSGLVDTYTITYTDTTTGTFTVTNGADGNAGATGNGIASIAKTGTAGLVDTYTITFTNGTDATFTVTNGADGNDGANGATGNGISTIQKTGTSGLVDTYTITYTNGGEATFTVTNGANGANGTNGTNGNDGNGIVSITKIGTVDLTDSYRITFTDGGHFDFTITNGANGTNGTNGTDGISITGTTIDSDGHLQVTNSNNQTTDAGSVRLFSTQINFVMAANSWTTLSNGDYEYTYSNASITADRFIDFGPALNITEEQLNALLGSKLILESISNGSVVFKAYGEVPSVDIPMLLVIEGSFQQVEPQITVDTALSTASTNPVENRAIANGFAAVQSELNDADVSYNKASIGSMTLGSHYSAIMRSDGTILASADGSQRGSTGTLHVNIDNVIPAGTYYLSGCHGGSSSTYYLNLRAKSGGTLLATCYSTPAQFTLSADTEVYAEIVATGGVVLTDQLFDIMIKDESVADTTFHKSSIGAVPIIACGHETLDIIFGDKDHYICQVYVINAQGQLAQFIMLNVNCDLRLYVSNIITDNTGSGSVNATINFINGENAIRIQEINGGNPRDIIVYAIGY